MLNVEYHAKVNPEIKEENMSSKQLERKVMVEILWRGTTMEILNRVANGEQIDVFGRPLPEDMIPTNERGKSDEPARVLKQKAALYQLGGLSRLRAHGHIPSWGEIEIPHGNIKLDDLVHPKTGISYAESIGIDKANYAAYVGMAVMMRQDVSMLYSVQRDDNVLFGRHGATRFHKQVAVVAAIDCKLIDTNNEEIKLVKPMTISVPNNLNAKMVGAITQIAGIDLHDARQSIDATKYMGSQIGTNPEFNMDSIIPLEDMPEDHWGKGLAKRNFLIASRHWSQIFYSVELTTSLWYFGINDENSNPITVAVKGINTLLDAGDGVGGHCTIEGFVKFALSIGMDEEHARKYAKHNHTFSFNFLSHLGFLKGHIHILHDASAWEYGDDVDFVYDNASMDTKTRVRAAYSNRAAVGFSPMKVKEDQKWLFANARQLMPEMLRRIDLNTIKDIPAWFMDDLQTAFETGYENLMLMEEEDEDDDGDYHGDKIIFNQMDSGADLDSVLIRQRKTAYYKNMRSMFDGRTSINRYVFNWFKKIERSVNQHTADKFCDFLLPARRMRTNVAAFAGNKVRTPNPISFLRRPGQSVPWSVVFDDALLRSRTFQFRMEYLDHDDGIIVMRMHDGNDPKVFMIKEPTSPWAGYLASVDNETAGETMLRSMPVRDHAKPRTDEDIERWLDDEERPRAKELGKQIHLKNMNALEYAQKSANIMHKLGNMPLLSALMTFAGRSGILVDRILLQASDAVDSQVLKDVSIHDIVRLVTREVIEAMRRGEAMDTRYLESERSKFLHDHLLREYNRLYPAEIGWVKDGSLRPTPNMDIFEEYDLVATIPQRLYEPLRKISATLMALANGPVSNLVNMNVVDGVNELAVEAFMTTREIQRTDGMTWREREEAIFIAALDIENRAYKLENYKPGMLSAMIAQVHATHDNARTYENSLHEDVPMAKTLPMVEYLSDMELQAYFHNISLPSFAVQVKNEAVLEQGMEYTFTSNGSQVFVTEEDFDFVVDDMNTAAFSMTSAALQWASLLNESKVKFMGTVQASHWAYGEAKHDRVAIFSPVDVREMLDWTV